MHLDRCMQSESRRLVQPHAGEQKRQLMADLRRVGPGGRGPLLGPRRPDADRPGGPADVRPGGPVTRLQRWSRTVAVLVTVGLVFALLGAACGAWGRSSRSWSDDLPRYRTNIREKIGDVREVGNGSVEKLQERRSRTSRPRSTGPGLAAHGHRGRAARSRQPVGLPDLDQPGDGAAVARRAWW